MRTLVTWFEMGGQTESSLACEQAHLVYYSREYLGGGSRREEWGEEKSSRRLASLADFRRQDTRANNTLSEPPRRLNLPTLSWVRPLKIPRVRQFWVT